MVNNHTLPTVLYTCAQQYQPDRSSHVQPILFQKPPNDGRWGRESVQLCTACVLWLFPWVKYWPYLGVSSTGFLAEFGVISGQIWYIVTLCNTSAGKFFQHVIASFFCFILQKSLWRTVRFSLFGFWVRQKQIQIHFQCLKQPYFLGPRTTV